MKKKGLIISTAVMVVVLIAALTTSTFAWFNLSGDVSISEFTLNTKAAEGLQIATYYFDASSSAIQYSSGQMELPKEGVKYWKGEVADFGQALTVASGAAQVADMYGASGDGATLFYNADANQGLLPTGKPDALAAAVANVNYFQLDFVLRVTASKGGNIYVKQLSVSPAGDEAKVGMAASTRIALFATTTAPTNAYPTYTVTKDGEFLYAPYDQQTYVTGQWKDNTDTLSNVYATKAGTFADPGVMSTVKLNDESVWGDKYITYDLTSKTTAPAAAPIVFGGNDGYTDVDAAKAGNANFDLGEVDYQDSLFLRLVIWFDGESTACNQLFAGGGVTVEINFGLTPTTGA